MDEWLDAQGDIDIDLEFHEFQIVDESTQTADQSTEAPDDGE